MVKNPPASARDVSRGALIPWSGTSPGEGSNPLRYSCLEWTEEPGGLQSMGLQSRTQWKRLSTCAHTHTHFCLVTLSLRLSLITLFKIATPASALPTLLLLQSTVCKQCILFFCGVSSVYHWDIKSMMPDIF